MKSLPIILLIATTLVAGCVGQSVTSIGGSQASTSGGAISSVCPQTLLDYLSAQAVSGVTTTDINHDYTFVIAGVGKTFDGYEMFSETPTRINCRYGSGTGENINYMYCSSYEAWLRKTTVSESGIIGHESMFASFLILNKNTFEVVGLTCSRK